MIWDVKTPHLIVYAKNNYDYSQVKITIKKWGANFTPDITTE